MNSPQASIIIRTYNEGRHLGHLLDSIMEQSFKDQEIILVDSGSTDDTLEIAKKYPIQILTIDPGEFSFGRALNRGCRAARGEYLVFISAHTYTLNGMWLYNILRPFEDRKVGMVYGRQLGNEITALSEERDLNYIFSGKSKILVEESFGNNANAAIRRSLWETIPFDEELPGLEDIDWAKKIQKKGHYVYYRADAVIFHVHDESLKQIFNRFRREAIAYRKIFPDFNYDAGRFALKYGFRALKDVLYGIKHHRGITKTAAAILYRLAQYQGLNAGYKFTGPLTAEMKNELFFPKGNLSVVIIESGRHELRNSSIPVPDDNDVLINVKYVGVCSTDLEVLEGKLDYYRSGWAKYPIVPGHEFSGVVAAAGKNVKDLGVGDRVVGECILGCGVCPACRNEDPISCRQRREVGVVNFNGAYSQYLKMPSAAVHKLPANADLQSACLVEPLAVSIRGTNRLLSGLRPGTQKVAVVGFGTIGNFCAQLMALKGHNVVIFDKNQQKVNLAQGLGFEARGKIEGLEKFGLLIEATGRSEALGKVLAESRTGARILLLGLPYSPLEFDFGQIVSFDKTIIGSVGSSRSDFVEAVRQFPKINFEALTQYIFAFEDYGIAWEKQKVGEVNKAIIRIGED